MMAATVGLDSGGALTETGTVTDTRETDLVGSETATKASTAASSAGVGSAATRGHGTETSTGIEDLVVAGESMAAATGMTGVAPMTGTTVNNRTLGRGNARSCSSSLALCPWRLTKRSLLPLLRPRPHSLHLRPPRPSSAEHGPWTRLPESVRSKHGSLGSGRKKSAGRSGSHFKTVARMTV